MATPTQDLHPHYRRPAVEIVNENTIKLLNPPVVVARPVSVSVSTPLGTSVSAQTFTYIGSVPIQFISSKLTDFSAPAVGEFGPDGKLYVATTDGRVAKMTLNDDFTQVVSTVVSEATPGRAILGMAFDPMDTGPNPPVYISSSDIFHGDKSSSSGGAINGKVVRVSGANLDVVEDIITGLPVQDGDHGKLVLCLLYHGFLFSDIVRVLLPIFLSSSYAAVMGLEFGDNGELYVQVAASTNGGIVGFIQQNDSYYSGATLVARLADPLFDGDITYDAPEGGSPNGGNGIDFFAFGLRNPFGIT